MLTEFAPSLYVADGPVVSFYGFPYPTRMVVVRLSSGGLWVWSPVAPTPALAAAIDALGPVQEIVSPNKIHHLFLAAWAARWPAARLHAPPGLPARRLDLRFASELGDEPDPRWVGEIDQTVFRGSPVLEEVAFLHRASRTAIVGDLVQRHEPIGGWRGLAMRLDGLVGEGGSTPREWRLTFLRRGPARAARARLLGWRPERLVVAHGACARHDATGILARATAWI